MTSEKDATDNVFIGREYPERPFASAAACVFKGNRILVIKRANPPSQGLWSIPGGAVDLGETVQEAVKREIREECSVEIEVEKVLNVENLIVPDETGRIHFHYVVSYLLARYVSGQERASSDATDVIWATSRELTGLDMNSVVQKNMLAAFKVAGLVD
ncbi:NUDIX hydrolase [Chloroflexota bacterium]